MNNLMDKRFYKVISLFIKAMLLFVSFYYIFQKLTTTDAFLSFENLIFTFETVFYLLLASVLMIVNWGLEAKKWQLLIAPHEQLSFIQSLQSIMAGVTLSIFTPNRIGEFAGRIFFLKKADKFIASGKSMIGSFLQLIITVVGGMIAIKVYINRGYDSALSIYSLFNPQKHYLWILLISCILMCLFGVLQFSFFETLRYNLKKIIEIKRKELIHIFILSLNRYLVFTFQYYLLLMAMGVNIELVQAFILISLTFFITSVIPTFALTEIVVRSAVAVCIFSVINPAQPVLIASASLLLWIINLAIPALIGSVFIGKFQFFKTH